MLVDMINLRLTFVLLYNLPPEIWLFTPILGLLVEILNDSGYSGT